MMFLKKYIAKLVEEKFSHDSALINVRLKCLEEASDQALRRISDLDPDLTITLLHDHVAALTRKIEHLEKTNGSLQSQLITSLGKEIARLDKKKNEPPNDTQPRDANSSR